MRRERKPLHCVDNVCTDSDRCFFCGAHKNQPCRNPRYAAQMKAQVENPLLRHDLSDDRTSVIVYG